MMKYEDMLRKAVDTFNRNKIDLRTMDTDKRKKCYEIMDAIDEACNADDRELFNTLMLEWRNLLL